MSSRAPSRALAPLQWNWIAPQANLERPVDLTGRLPVVWQASVPTAATVQSHLLSLLAPEERSRLGRFRRHDDALRYLTARGLLRTLLAAHLGVDAPAVGIEYEPGGKPRLPNAAGHASVHFNVSHSHDLVVIALSEVVAVGVDVEQVLPRDDLDELAAYVFPPREYGCWRRTDPSQRIVAFHEAWVRHEALVKAAGTGLGCSGATCRLLPQAVRTLAVQDGYRGAVAWMPLSPWSGSDAERTQDSLDPVRHATRGWRVDIPNLRLASPSGRGRP